MNTIKFAQLVNWLTKFGMHHLDKIEMEELYKCVQPDPVSSNVFVSQEVVNELLACMNNANSKIEAIRAYRMLTGATLKDSKDAVEKYWKVQS